MLIFILACAQSKDIASDDSIATDYYSAFSDYESWDQPEEWQGLQISQSVHGASVQIFWNDIAKTAFLAGEEIPDGGAILKEGFVNEEGTEFQALTMMVKRADFDAQANDWYWASYDEDGGINNSGQVDFCISCHQSSANDYLLFPEE